MKNGRLILIDSNNIAYRAFYALPQTIVTSTGQMTNAVYGFTSMLLKIIEEKKPDVMVCTFDSKGPTFRHEAYDDYKATRKKMPDELIGQMPLIKEVAEALNIKSFEMGGFEADDIIATLVKKCRDIFDEIMILSSDKDILQLVSDKVKVLALKKGITDTVLFNDKEVKDKFGVSPGSIKDLLALMGDSSDNIPGVGGIGPKTAESLINEFGSVEEIYNQIDKVKNEKLKKLLIEEEDSARKSLELTELKDDLDIDPDEFINRRIKKLDFKKAESIFSSLEFNTLKKRLKTVATVFGPPVSEAMEELQEDRSGKKIPSIRKIQGKIYLNKINSSRVMALKEKKIYISIVPDWFKKNYNISDGEKETASFADYKFPGLLILKDTECNFYLFDSFTLKNSEAIKSLAGILENNEITKCGFGFKKVYKFFKKYNIDVNGNINDYKIQYLLLNPEKSKINIPEIFTEFFNLDLKTFQSTSVNLGSEEYYHDGELPVSLGSGAIKVNVSSQMNFGFEDQGLEDYQSKNGDVHFKSSLKILENLMSSGRIKGMPELIQMLYFSDIEKILTSKIKKEGLERLYKKIEAPLIKVLADMEFKGVNIDRDYLGVLIREYDESIKELTTRIHKLCNVNFNINSTQQLAKILYEKLNLKATKKTKTGYSTNAATLLSIQDSHPVIRQILDYREKVKLKNTYIDVLPGLIDVRDKRVHTTYNQLGTTTGRISSNNPNLQNIPVRTELGRQIRKAFIPGKGYNLLLSADYSQIELRVLAHLADDGDLILAFKNGMDIHTQTAAEIFGVSYDDVGEDLRRKAKAINFGILYGMTEFGLKVRLSISEEEARQYISLYFSRYPAVKKYINKMIADAYKSGCTTTMFGRKRYIRELASSNANLRNLGERFAVNTPIQGSAADIMKLATVALFEKLQKTGYDSNIILHVHDEIVLELKEKDLPQIREIVTSSMENCVDLKTGLKVDIKTGENWFI